ARDIESVSTKLSPGVHTNPARVEAAVTGVPSLRAMAPGAVVRLAGVDPVADAVALSRRMWNPYNQPSVMGEGHGDYVFTMSATPGGTGGRNGIYAPGHRVPRTCAVHRARCARPARHRGAQAGPRAQGQPARLHGAHHRRHEGRVRCRRAR